VGVTDYLPKKSPVHSWLGLTVLITEQCALYFLFFDALCICTDWFGANPMIVTAVKITAGFICLLLAHQPELKPTVA